VKRLKRILALALTLLLLFGIMPSAAAESASATTLRLAAYSGSVSVANASGKSQTIKTDMRLYSGYTLATGKASAAYVSLDGTKAIKFDSSSKGSVKKSGNKLEVCLDDGKLFFNVTAPLASNESLNIRTGTMVTGIRGSYGWVTRTEVVLVHGHVTVTCINPVTGETRTTELYSGEKVYYDPGSTVTGDPKLKEIDFIKEIITNDDFPAFVVDEMRKDESLQTPVIEDVPSVDVPKLLGDYEQIKAAEDAATEAKEAELAGKLEEQTEFIENDPVDYLFEDEGGAVYTPTAYNVTFGGGNGMEFSAIDPLTDIAPGSNFSFHIEPDAGYALHADYLNVNAGGAAVTLTPNGTGYDATFTVNSDVNVTAEGAFYQAATLVAAETAFTAGETYAELIADDAAGGTPGYTIAADKTLRVSANLTNLPDYVNNGTIIINNTGSVSLVGGVTNGATGTIDIQGALTVAAGGILANYGTVTNKANMTVEAGGTFNNYSGNTVINTAGSTITIAGTFNNGDGTNDGRIVNEAGAPIDTTATGALVNSSTGRIENAGGIDIGSAFTNGGAIENASGATFTANSGNTTIQAGGVLTNAGTFTFANVYNYGSIENKNVLSCNMLDNGNATEHDAVITNTSTGSMTVTSPSANSAIWTNYGTCSVFSLNNNAGGTLNLAGGEFSTNYGFFDNGGAVNATGETGMFLYCGETDPKDVVAIMDFSTNTLTIRLNQQGGGTTIDGDTTQSIFAAFDTVETVVIEEGITEITYCMLKGFNELTSCSIPKSVVGILIDSFTGTANLTEIHFAGTTAEWNAINSSWTSPATASAGLTGKTIVCTDGSINIP
jgi:hypothetical protein